MLRVVAASVAAGAVAAELIAPAGSAWLAALDVAVALAFTTGAIAVARAAPLVAATSLAVGATWAIGTVAGGAAGVLAHRVPLALLLLAYPGGRLRGVGIWTVAGVAVLAPFAVGTGRYASVGALGLVALVVATRAARTTAVLRTPLTAAAIAAGATAAAAGTAAAGLANPTVCLVVYDVVLLALAGGLLVPLATRRWSAATASGLVAELATGPPRAPITARLADVLNDPGLQLLVRPSGGSWTDEAGLAAPDPTAGVNGLALTRRTLDDGTEVALIHHAAAISDRATADAAVAVAALAVDNAQQERDVRVRVAQLRRLRRGLLDAADDERRQLEHELRAGSLRQADDLDDRLAALPAHTAVSLRSELALARSELTAIARGLYPEALAREGLAGALTAAAARSAVPVIVDTSIGAAAIPEPVALTTYFLATEALANIAKHARASSASLDVSVTDGELVVRIVDDGIGGTQASGSGLTGLRERVTAVDGVLEVSSPTGGGTRVEARMPI